MSGSYTIVSIIIYYNLNPIADFNGPSVVCSGNDLVLSPFITNDNGNYDYLWSTGETTPELIVNAGGTYSVSITDLFTGCMTSISVEVSEDESITLGTATNLIGCAGVNTFDLTVNLSDILLGQDSSQFSIDFFEFLSDAISNTDSIFVPTEYEQLGAQVQTIFVRVQTPNSNCFSISEFDVITQDACQSVIDCAELRK